MNGRPVWKSLTMGSCVDRIESGVSVRSIEEPGSADGPRVLKSSCVYDGRFRPDESKPIDPTDVGRAKLSVRAGTVVVSRMNTPAYVGASGYVEDDVPTTYLPDRLWAITPTPAVDGRWLHTYLSWPRTRRLLSEAASGTSGSMKNLSQDSFRSVPILLPPLPEQRRIAEILRTWDDAIENARQNRDLAASKYRSALDVLLIGERSSATLLAMVTRPITRRNTDLSLGRDVVMGVTNAAGIVPMRSQTIAADLSRYQVLPPRAFAYNPMRINVGSIAMSRLNRDVLVSPDYVLFECVEHVLLPEYLDHVLETRRWRHDVNAGASGSVRTRTYYDDLAAIPIYLPSLATQSEIVALLDSMTAELALLDRKVELLRTQKRGLMQKLLTGDIRVIPEEEQP